MTLNADELKRYARHLSLPEIGIKGQERLKESSILCVGSGGLGSPLLIYLASAGVGHIGIIDFDIVEISNLQRQIIHNTKSLGKTKTSSAKAHIIAINPNCKVDIFETRLSNQNALEIIKSYDLICDCTDNLESRYLINDACIILGKPIVYGSIHKFEGQAAVFNLDKDSPNYRDLVPNPPPPELIPSCSEGGVIGVLPGLIGIIQATEVIKIITGIGTSLNGSLLTLNALTMRFKTLKLIPNQGNKKIKSLIDYKKFCSGKDSESERLVDYNIKEISPQSIKLLLKENKKNICIIDVRNQNEFELEAIKGARLFPLNIIEEKVIINEIKKLSSNFKLYFYCQSGKRSIKAIMKLKVHGIDGVNITGGLEAWNKNNLIQDN